MKKNISLIILFSLLSSMIVIAAPPIGEGEIFDCTVMNCDSGYECISDSCSRRLGCVETPATGTPCTGSCGASGGICDNSGLCDCTPACSNDAGCISTSSRGCDSTNAQYNCEVGNDGCLNKIVTSCPTGYQCTNNQYCTTTMTPPDTSYGCVTSGVACPTTPAYCEYGARCIDYDPDSGAYEFELINDFGKLKGNPDYICQCNPPPRGSDCPGESEYWVNPNTIGCADPCSAHLDYDSYRKEYNDASNSWSEVMQTSVGSPDTNRGMCLTRRGMVYSDELNQLYYDSCLSGRGDNVVRQVYLDGVSWGVERLINVDKTCPNNFICENSKCLYSCANDGDCAGSTYCTDGHCCAVGWSWDAGGYCVEEAHCNSGPSSSDKCTVAPSSSSFWDNVEDTKYCLINDPRYQACCLTGEFGDPNFKDYLDITHY